MSAVSRPERILDGEIVDTRLDSLSSYDGVRSRRIFAFLIDYATVVLLMVPVAVLVLLVGLLTLGLAWLLFGFLGSLVALTYVWFTLGSEKQATLGMRAMDIRLERLDGGRVDGLTAVVHSVLFWAANAILTPLILLVMLFSDRKRALHDLLLGTVVVRTDR